MAGRILNLHGLYGSPENTNYELLRSIGCEVISPSINYVEVSPNDIIDNLVKMSKDDDLIVGQSFGGFFALVVSDILGVPCIVTNPCVPPNRYISRLVAEHGDFYSPTYLDQLKGMHSAHPTMYNTENRSIYMILGNRDEVIDHSFTQWLVDSTFTYYIENGKHSFSGNDTFKSAFLQLLEGVGSYEARVDRLYTI